MKTEELYNTFGTKQFLEPEEKERAKVYLCYEEVFEPEGEYEIAKIVDSLEKAKEWLRQERENGRIHSFFTTREVE